MLLYSLDVCSNYAYYLLKYLNKCIGIRIKTQCAQFIFIGQNFERGTCLYNMIE